MQTVGRDAPKARSWRYIACTLVILLSAWIQTRVVTRTIVDNPIRADAAHYVAYAWNLKQFHVFSRAPTWIEDVPKPPLPDKLTLPGYPAFLSLFMKGAPDLAFEQRVVGVQMLIGILTCSIVLLLAIEILPFGAALAVGLLTAISPHLATINTYLLTESLFTLLVVASLYALACAAAELSRTHWYVASGFLLGLASLVRPQLQLLPFVIVILCVMAPALRPRLPKVLLGLCCFIALLMPWHLRNAQVQRPAGDPDLLASTLYHGSFPQMMYENDPRSLGSAYRFDPEAMAHSRDVHSAVDHIVGEFQRRPGAMLRWYLLGKPEFFLSWNLIAGAGSVFIYPVLTSPYLTSKPLVLTYVASFWLHWPVTLLALLAVVAAIAFPLWLGTNSTQRRQLRLVALVLGVVLVMHMIGAPYPRYGIPFRPLVYVLGVAMLTGGWVRLRKGRSET